MNVPLSRLNSAVLAGIVAISVNTGLLAGAEAIGIRTAHGGLLRLLQAMGGWLADAIGFGAWWQAVLLPATSDPNFQFGFHIFVGVLMAIAYGLVVEPALFGRPWVKGLVGAVVVWLVNSAVVLPLIDEGLAGSRHLTITGMICFALAHTAFFVLLAVLYDRMERRQPASR